VRNTSPFVDLHCHLLPGIDDGPTCWAESLAMARLAAADGISTVVATPHQLGAYGRNHGDTIRGLCRQLQERLDQEGIPLDVLPGGDVRIEPEIVPRIRNGEVVTLSDRGRYVLLELPHEIYFPLDRLMRGLGAAGLVAVLSHPERNQGILRRPHLVESLVDAGWLLQLTAGSLVGTFGPQVRSFAERLVLQGLAHFIATDGHGSKSRRPLMRRAFDRVAQIAGERCAAELCCDNPARVVTDRAVPAGRREPKGVGLASWRRLGKAS
jgi:protein-tyrosine phosphatase